MRNLLAADIEPRPTHARLHSLDNQAPFKFTNGSDNHDECATERAARIDVLAKGYELDVQVIKFVEHFEKVPHRPCHPVERPNEHGIKAMPPCVRQERIETG